MKNYRIDISGLPEHLRQAAIKVLEAKVYDRLPGMVSGNYTSNFATLFKDHSTALSALRGGKTKIGPKQNATIWGALLKGAFTQTELSKEYEAFVRAKNPELAKQKRV